MIYRLKYAKSESNFDADFEHPTLKGKGGLVGFRKTLKVQGSTGGFSKKATSKQSLSKSLSESGFIPAQKNRSSAAGVDL